MIRLLNLLIYWKCFPLLVTLHLKMFDLAELVSFRIASETKGSL